MRILFIGWMIAEIWWAGVNGWTFLTASLYGQEIKALHHASLIINGEQKDVPAFSIVNLVAGDVFSVKECALTGTMESPELVNVIGYVDLTDKAAIDDRKKVINTQSDLDPRLAIDRQGQEYLVIVKSGQKEHGWLKIRVVKPKLEKLVLLINGKKREAKQGTQLKIKKADTLGISEIKTNLDNMDSLINNVDIKVNLARRSKDDAADDPKSQKDRYEFQLLRRNIVFARFPVIVETR
jgi:hypothetical protein